MKDLYHKYGAVIFMVLFLWLSYLVFKPFIIPIISAALVAYIFSPLYNFIKSKIKNKTIASVIMILFVMLIVIGVSSFIISTLIGEIPSVYSNIVASIQKLPVLNTFFERISNEFYIDLNLKRIITTAFNTILRFLQSFIQLIPGKIISIIMGTFFLFFFFRDGDKIIDIIPSILPFGKKKTIILFNEIKGMIDAVVYGQLITASIQSVLATVGYMIAGINAPFFWGVMTFLGALIPMVGPAFIYVPLGLSLIISGLASPEIGMLKGILLLIYGLTIISSVDNIIKPLVISDKVKIHPAIIAVGMIGGLTVFGFIGLLIGPLVLIIIYTLFRVYELHAEVIDILPRRKKHRKTQKKS